MSRYECPDCGGGFPSPADAANECAGRCPWCGRGFSTLDGVAEEDVVNDEIGEITTACLDRLERYNRGEKDAFADIVSEDDRQEVDAE